jgi:DNA-binding XRE family transcriptional regulator
MITAAQCRAARAWLDLTQAELAQMIGRNEATVRRFEAGSDDSVIALALQHVLEERGIRFLDTLTEFVNRRGIEGPE